MNLLTTLKTEIFRIWPLLLIIALALVILGDMAQLAVQLYRLSMVALVLIATHLIRKALFPYLNLQAFTVSAKESPTGSGLFVLALFVLLSTIIYVAVLQ
jgi:hypothetical protein